MFIDFNVVGFGKFLERFHIGGHGQFIYFPYVCEYELHEHGFVGVRLRTVGDFLSFGVEVEFAE